MNSHSRPDDLIDLGLRHSLKNWANHKKPPSDCRDRLLEAAREEAAQMKRKPSKFNFGWSFRFQSMQEAINIRPIYNYRLETVYSFKANMAIL
jgi:hypothetical protein